MNPALDALNAFVADNETYLNDLAQQEFKLHSKLSSAGRGALDFEQAAKEKADREARERADEEAEAKRQAEAMPDKKKIQYFAGLLVDWIEDNRPHLKTDHASKFLDGVLDGIQAKIAEMSDYSLPKKGGKHVSAD
jgi:hypothetical protein